MAKRDGKSRRPAGRHLSAVPAPERVGDIDIRNRYNEEVRWETLLLEPVSDWFLAVQGRPEHGGQGGEGTG